MRPIDVVIRDRIAPVLKAAGFRKSGQTFRLQGADGAIASVVVRSFRLGRHDAEFHVDLGVEPRMWNDWIHRNGGKGHYPLWDSRLGPTGSGAGGALGLWSIDLADEEAGVRLTDALTEALPELLRHLDPEVMVEWARTTPGGIAPYTLLLLAARRYDEVEERLSALEASDSAEQSRNDEFEALVRSRMPGNHAVSAHAAQRGAVPTTAPPDRPAEGGWISVEDDGTDWGDPRLSTYDYIPPSQGSTGGVRSMIAPYESAHDFRLYSDDVVTIELSDEAFTSLDPFPRYLRSVRLGKLRKDHSLPLMPPADRVWIQAVLDDATLVVRPAGANPAFFRLGHLGIAALRMARLGYLPVLILVGTNVLPDPTMRAKDRARIAGRAWGGLVSCTEASPDQVGATGTAWQHHAATSPELVLEGAEAAKAALERSRQARSGD